MNRAKKTALAILLAAGAVTPCTGAGAPKALPAPQNLTVTSGDGGPEFSWGAVAGATCYRLAVFQDQEKDSAPQAAVWLKSTRYTYGRDTYISKIGNLPSKEPLPLKKGATYKWIVAAASAGGARKSAWAGSKFEYPLPQAPSPVEAPVSGTASATPTPSGGELTVSPENETASAQAAPATPTTTPTPETDNVLKEAPPDGDPSLERGQRFLKDKKWENAQKEYRRLCDQDPKNFEAWSGLGDAYLGANMRVEAVEAYRTALTLKDDEKIKAWLKENVRSY